MMTTLWKILRSGLVVAAFAHHDGFRTNANFRAVLLAGSVRATCPSTAPSSVMMQGCLSLLPWQGEILPLSTRHMQEKTVWLRPFCDVPQSSPKPNSAPFGLQARYFDTENLYTAVKHNIGLIIFIFEDPMGQLRPLGDDSA